MMAKTMIVAAAVMLAGLTALPSQAQSPADLAKIRLPEGFQISIFARVPEARSMAVATELGVVFVGNRRGSSVYAAIDADGDGVAERVVRVARGLAAPNGIVWRKGSLYVAENHRVIRYDIDRLSDIGKVEPKIVFEGLPRKGTHGWRYMAVDGRGRLHVAVGAPCNVCAVSGLEGTIIRLDTPLNGGRAEIVARGIRNSVGIDFNPLTGDMFFTDNGSDFLGDDLPPDELNHATADGLHFGFPFFGGGGARTREFAEQKILGRLVAPVIEFGAHVAALGIYFYRGDMFPRAYRGDAFVAQHGSWNRRVPVGYRVMRIRFGADGKAISKEIFADGWLQGAAAWGRPVDVKELADGSLLVSDDRAGVIYRISTKAGPGAR